MKKAEFPNIDYTFWLSQYSWEGFSSMRGMINTMINRGYIDDDVNEENITDKISLKIKEHNSQEYNSYNKDTLLFEIFKLIQTWGGKSAGSHTLGIVENWNEDKFSKYKVFVELINKYKIIESFDYLVKTNKIEGLSYSFVPKHICFWSGNGNRINGYPILDNVISILVYNTRSAKNVPYEQFINDISNFSKVLNQGKDDVDKLNLAQIEMAIFAFSGFYWKTQKTGYNDFKINILEKHINSEEAIRISERNI
jgi:hypothetical protein